MITKSLDFIDRNVSEHEQTIDKLMNSQQVDAIMTEMEERELMKSQIYNSAWEAHRKIEGEDEVASRREGVSQEDFPL